MDTPSQMTTAQIAMLEYDLYMQDTHVSDRRTDWLPFDELPPLFKEAWIKLVLRIVDRVGRGEISCS